MKTSLSGFSLIEMAIVLFIMSAVSVGALNVIAIQRENKGTRESEASLDSAVQLLRAYLVNHKKLPCPADPTLPPTHADFGKAVAAVAPCGSLAISGLASDIYLGSLPARELGMDPKRAVDGWGNQLRYMVIRAATTEDSWLNVSWNPLSFIELENNGAPVISDGVVGVFSTGMNANGALTYAGQTIPAPPVGAVLELENLDGDNVLTTGQYSSIETAPFDDVVMVLTEAGLTAPLIASGQLESKINMTLQRMHDMWLEVIGRTSREPGFALPPAAILTNRISAWGDPISYDSSGDPIVRIHVLNPYSVTPFETGGDVDSILILANYPVGGP